MLQVKLDAEHGTLTTVKNPAYWLEPGEKESQPSPGCTVAINTEKLSNVTLTTTVELNALGEKQMFLFITDAYVPYGVRSVQMESPTGYMGKPFSNFWALDLSTGHVSPVPPDPPGELPSPIIIGTADGSIAQGALLSDRTASYAHFAFYFADDANWTTKWSAVLRRGAFPSPFHLQTKTYVAVGTVSEVAALLMKAYKMG